MRTHVDNVCLLRMKRTQSYEMAWTAKRSIEALEAARLLRDAQNNCFR